MPRVSMKTDPKLAKHKRALALAGAASRKQTEPRQSSTGLVSMAVKIVDPHTEYLIAAFLAKRQDATQ